MIKKINRFLIVLIFFFAVITPASVSEAISYIRLGGSFFPATRQPYNPLVTREANYIVSCQYLLSLSNPAYGAINNVYGSPTWVVPRENALAILGLIKVSQLLQNNSYLVNANLAADYLIRIQDTDGGWYDQYSFATNVVVSKSPTQTAEVMLALERLGYQSIRYNAMKHGAQFLLTLQDVVNKQGVDDGLLGGGEIDATTYHTWRWASDNSFGYWALKAAEKWAVLNGDTVFAGVVHTAANRILDGINNYLHVNISSDPDFGVWRRVIDQNDVPVNPGFHDWINYAPQMLDVPATGVGNPAVGIWIHNHLQDSMGALVWDDGSFNQRQSPGYSFQASLAWIDLGQSNYYQPSLQWALLSGLWQTVPDSLGIEGGWIDWKEPAGQANQWERFIDTSFYSIAAFNGGYNFQVQ